MVGKIFRESFILPKENRFFQCRCYRIVMNLFVIMAVRPLDLNVLLLPYTETTL